ncbi:hypothetical protein AGMMS50267_05540 [Spirochaetia bacterium]|nr:hypothetical protein AGMMS50267_05540 [Spirochaetia bacterium]
MVKSKSIGPEVRRPWVNGPLVNGPWVRCLTGFLLVFGAVSLSAGDIATFVDLGFSPDGRTYMFAQYGVQTKTLRPWADLYAVDVSLNDFVDGGRVSYIHGAAVVSGQDGAGALSRVLSRNAALAARYGVNFLNQGRLLYVAMDEKIPLDAIEFRDFDRNSSYRASLNSRVDGTGANLKSSFHITLEQIAPNGSTKNYIVGNPQIKRPLVTDYRISKVLISPDDGSLILVIEERMRSASGFDIRYMVETLEL